MYSKPDNGHHNSQDCGRAEVTSTVKRKLIVVAPMG